ncbi:MAG: Tfp pilus assembly protein FimT/FimU [Pseudohongiellaceae bacterium]
MSCKKVKPLKLPALFQLGFSMVELTTVVLVLAIIASVALPRLLGVGDKAKIAALEAMGAAMASAAQKVYAQAVLQGLQNQATADVDLDGDGVGDVLTRYGYPDSTRQTGITQALNSSVESEWAWSTNGSRSQFFMTLAEISIGGTPGVYINNTRVTPTNCYLTYFRPTNTGPNPRIEYTTSGC